jgi:CelD/BcsL family acetyltransferase involved in cellulose biosynthesis
MQVIKLDSPFLPGNWQDQVAELWAQAPSLYNHPDWLAAWWSTYSNADDQASGLAVFDGDELVGWAPAFIRSETRKSMRVKVLRLVGAEHVGPSDSAVIIKPGLEAAVYKAWQGYIKKSRLADLVIWEAVIPPTEGLHGAGLRTEVGRLALPRTVDALWQGLSKNKRKELRRRRKALDKHAPTVMSVHEGEDAFSQSILFSLNTKRFSQLGIDGGFANSALQRFFVDIAKSKSIRTRINILWCGQTPVAAVSHFEVLDHWFGFQGGIDPAFAEGSPGNVLDVMTFEQGIAEGISQYDFGPGAQDYKNRFGARMEERYQWYWAASSIWKLPVWGRQVVRALRPAGGGAL